MAYLSLAIWIPIAFGLVLLAIGSDRHARGRLHSSVAGIEPAATTAARGMLAWLERDHGRSDDEHGVAVRIEAVAHAHGLLVGAP